MSKNISIPSELLDAIDPTGVAVKLMALSAAEKKELATIKRAERYEPPSWYGVNTTGKGRGALKPAGSKAADRAGRPAMVVQWVKDDDTTKPQPGDTYGADGYVIRVMEVVEWRGATRRDGLTGGHVYGPALDPEGNVCQRVPRPDATDSDVAAKLGMSVDDLKSRFDDATLESLRATV